MAKRIRRLYETFPKKRRGYVCSAARTRWQNHLNASPDGASKALHGNPKKQAEEAHQS